MATYQRGKYWWYRFRFAGERIDEPTKSTSRTVAKEAERQHRRALEAGYNNFKEVRQNRVRILEEIIDEYLTGYRLRYRSATFAEYALGHVKRLLGTKIVADITEISVLRYQEDRLREKAAPKSINEEVRFLLKMLGDPGEVIRAHLKKTKQLKLTVHKQIGKAFDSEETQNLATNAKSSRSPHMYPAFMLARNGGLRDTEIKTLTWGQINFVAKTVQVGRAKSEAGEGRIVPLNSEAYQALVDHRAWYLKRFGEMRDGVREIRDEWYVFPWGKPRPSDPARHITSFKTAWKTTRRNAKVKGRWHDNRHTLITEMAENGAGDETIMSIAGHVDRQMLRHYSHIRMKAKREAVESVIASRRGDSQLGSASKPGSSA
jgi:integrase